MRSSPAVAAGLLAALLSACGSATTGGAGGNSPQPPAASSDPGRAQRAAQLLDRLAAARKSSDSPALGLGDHLEQQDGDWEPAVGENNKLAWATGHLVAVGPLPTAPGPGRVLHGSGRGVSTTVMSADDALAAMTARRSDCGGCTDLKVTGAVLATMDVPTSGGTVSVPAWRFTLEGTAVTLLRVAVPVSGLVRVSPPSTQPEPGDGSAADSFSLLPGGRTLRLHFVGSPDEPGPCGADYRGEQYASSTAVVVTVVEVPRKDTGQDVACTAIGMLRTVDVVLADPLGDRTVLNLAGGGVVVRS
jgi:hypothetical protein